MSPFEPVYVRTYESGALKEKREKAFGIIKECVLCPRRCGVQRLSGERGVCRTGERAVVASFNAHFGEEAPLVGEKGSGTIFFSHCNLLCVFCQNFEISHGGEGSEVSAEELAGMMLALQRRGCHNINFVTPTHVVPQILAALEIAAESGLRIPLVYNSGGYDSVETLKLLRGVFDIYMPDFKFWDSELSEKAMDAADYPVVAQKALKEMHSQVGDLVTDENGIAQRGLIIRHLVMPGGIAGTREVMEFIAKDISLNSYVNIMPQYRPCGKAHEMEELAVYPSEKDFQEAASAAEEAGLTRLNRPKRVFMIC